MASVVIVLGYEEKKHMYNNTQMDAAIESQKPHCGKITLPLLTNGFLSLKALKKMREKIGT